MKEKDYKEEYEQFWKGIVENEDGTLNKDQIMRELADFSMVINNCELAYSTMTDQTISKCNTNFSNVQGIFYDLYTSKYELSDFVDNDLEIILDDLIFDKDVLEGIKEALREFFDLPDEDNDEVGEVLWNLLKE